MGAVRKRKLRKAMMEDVMVVDIATWHRIGAEQSAKEIQLSGYKMQVESAERKNKHLEQVHQEDLEVRKNLERTLLDLKGDNDHLEKVIKDLEERLKFEGRRSADALAAFGNVSEAAAFTAQVSMKMVRLMDDLDLEFIIKPKEEQRRR